MARKETRKDTWTAAAANDLAAKMTARAKAEFIAQLLNAAKTYEDRHTPSGDETAAALRSVADNLTG